MPEPSEIALREIPDVHRARSDEHELKDIPGEWRLYAVSD